MELLGLIFFSLDFWAGQVSAGHVSAGQASAWQGSAGQASAGLGKPQPWWQGSAVRWCASTVLGLPQLGKPQLSKPQLDWASLSLGGKPLLCAGVPALGWASLSLASLSWASLSWVGQASALVASLCCALVRQRWCASAVPALPIRQASVVLCWASLCCAPPVLGKPLC